MADSFTEQQSRVDRNKAITQFFKALTELVQVGTKALQDKLKRPRGGRTI